VGSRLPAVGAATFFDRPAAGELGVAKQHGAAAEMGAAKAAGIARRFCRISADPTSIRSWAVVASAL
jgi:hypothetical protein